MANDVEINVRVSNQTGTGMAGVTTAMGRLRTAARTSSREVRDLNRDLERLRASGSVQVGAEFHGDAGEIAAAASAMRSLRNDTSRAGTAMGNLAPRALAAAASLEAVRAAARDAADALRTLRGRTAATAAAMTDMRTTTTAAANSLRTLSTRVNSADGRMDSLSSRTHALSTNLDGLDGSLRRVGGSMAGLRGSVGSLGSGFGGAAGGSRKLLMAAIALSPALVPITAAVSPLVPALGAAGVAMATFGAALIPQILAMGKIGEAHKNYKKAVEDSGRASQQAAEAEKEWLKQVAKAPPEVRKAAASLDVMQDSYKGWTDSLASDTLPVATKGFGVLSMLFPKLTPLVRATSAEMDRLMNRLAVGVNSKGFDEFMVKLGDFSQRTLRAAVDGMVRFGQAMNRGIQSDGFREFLAYVRDSGPMVGETLANLGRAMGKLVAAAADTGVGILTIVNALAKLVNAVPTELLSVLLQMAFAMKALQLVTTGLGPAFMAAAAGASNFVRAARFGGVASAIQGVTASLTAMQRASIVLAVIAAVAIGINELAEKAKGAPPDVDRLTTSLKNLGTAGQFTGELKRAFVDMDGFAKSAERLRMQTEAYDKLKKFTSLIPMGQAIDKLVPKMDQLVNGTNSVAAGAEKFKAFDTAFANLAKGGNAAEAAKQFAGFEKALLGQGRTMSEITAMFPQYSAAVAAIAADQEMAARSMGYFGEQAVAVQAKLELQRQSAEGVRQSINALNQAYLQARGDSRAMEAAIDAATESLKANGATLDENTEKGRANNQALDNLAASTMKAAEATLANGAGWEAAAAIWERGRGKLLESAQAMGMTKAQAAALADQILATPDKTAYLRGNLDDLQAKLRDAQARLAAAPLDKQGAIRAEISDLLAKVRQAQGAVNSLDDRTVFINTVYRTFREQHPGGQAQAHGGIIGAAGGGPRSRMTLVGEQGPELVDLAPGSRVRSNPDSKRIAAGMAASGGGGSPIVVQVMLDGRMVAKAIVDPLQAEVSSRGGNVQQVLGRGN